MDTRVVLQLFGLLITSYATKAASTNTNTDIIEDVMDTWQRQNRCSESCVLIDILGDGGI